jgi:hypothetical protein
VGPRAGLDAAGNQTPVIPPIAHRNNGKVVLSIIKLLFIKKILFMRATRKFDFILFYAFDDTIGL